MNKILLSILIMATGFMALVSCQNEEEAKNLSTDNHEMEYAYLGELEIVPISKTRNDIENIYEVTFKESDEISDLHILLIQNESEYGCNVDGDEEIDFYIKVLDPSMGIYQYLNKEKDPLQEFSLIENDKAGEFILNVIKLYDNPMLISNTRSESWSDCFSRRMGSTTGIILNVVSGFAGPVGPLGVAAGAALSCAIWTPY